MVQRNAWYDLSISYSDIGMDLLEMVILSSLVPAVLCCHGIPFQHCHSPYNVPVTMVTASNDNNNDVVSITLFPVTCSTDALYHTLSAENKAAQNDPTRGVPWGDF